MPNIITLPMFLWELKWKLVFCKKKKSKRIEEILNNKQLTGKLTALLCALFIYTRDTEVKSKQI